MFSGTEKYKEVIFEGKIRYFNKFYDIAEACENLVAMVEAVDENKKVPVAFDMEWPYDVKKKISGKTSLIQICMDIDECFLFHLPLLSKLPASLSIFLNHPRVILHGVNIVEDVKKLGKDFPYFNTDSMFNNCLDLRTWYYEVTSHQIRSMKFLVKHALKKDINKSLQISSWQEVPLNEAQMKYAATDVFISQKIFERIFSIQNQHAQDVQEFFIIFGKELDDYGDLPGKNFLINEMEKKIRKSENYR